MVDFGTDVATPTGDMDALGSYAEGIPMLCQDLAARLETPPGGLYYDRDYGFGIVLLVGEALHESTPAKLWQIQDGVAAECTKDERVRRATVTIELVPQENASAKLTITVIGDSALGPFRLVLSVDDVSLEVLEAGEA